MPSLSPEQFRPLAWKLASQYADQLSSRSKSDCWLQWQEELFAAGMAALCEASARFNSDRPTSYSFARAWLRGAMLRYCRNEKGRFEGGYARPKLHYGAISLSEPIGVDWTLIDLIEDARCSVDRQDLLSSLRQVWEQEGRSESERMAIACCVWSALHPREGALLAKQLEVSLQTVTRAKRRGAALLRKELLLEDDYASKR